MIRVLAAILVILNWIGHSASGLALGPRIRPKAHDEVVDIAATAVSPSSSPSAEESAATAGRRLRQAVPVERRAVIACQGNQLELTQPRDAMCPEATAMCNSTQAQPEIMVWYYSRTPGQPWQRAGQACIPLAQAAAVTGGGAVPVVTVADFRRLPLPAGVVHVQPGRGRTLVNVPTNVYVAAERVVIPTTVLGQPVQVRATPVRYVWTFGDGANLTTTDPGAPYPDLRTTHTYVAPGAVRIGLATTYRGEYSVAGGPWLPVQGTADVATPGVPLTVVAARSELVDDVLPT